ncbi:TolC family protein [Emticicia sp. CRIBPO]|uniref:TolC family protein n=1 Tax=Emticicia sp. CRIBPO TaxID=2683258 RepID=UPI00141238F1|nr:TolC family protein [Emticicia sp. CRIBPO]NBA86694.1 TolC family protein [Emticicia sp. CRIBPO]
MKKITFYLCLTCIGGQAAAQSGIVQSYVQQGLESNLALKQQNLEFEKAVKNIDIARSNLSPRIAFAPNYTLAAGGRKLDFPIGDLLNPVYKTLNQLTSSSNFPMVENVSQQLAPNNFHETKVTFQYPIFNTDIKYNILLQKELLQTEEAKRKALKYELRYTIETAYYQYLQTLETIKLIDQSRTVLSQFLVLNQKLVANNVALKDAVMSTEYEISKLDQQNSVFRKNRESAKAYFNFLLNRDLTTDIIADTSLVNIPVHVEDLERSKQSALINRPEFNQLQSGIKVNETILLMQTKNAKLPQLSVGGSTGFQGFGYTFRNQAYALAQIGLQWDLYHGYEKKHKMQQTKIQKSILETKIEEVKQQVQLQVTQAYYDLVSSEESLKSALVGVEKTEKVLKIVESRYKNGQAIYVEYFKAQNDDMVAKLNVSLARYDMLVKKSMLDRWSGSGL